MSDRKRPLSISIIGWMMLIGGVLLLVAAVAPSFVPNKPPNEQHLYALQALVLVGGGCGTAIAVGLLSMKRWAADAYLILTAVGLVMKMIEPYLPGAGNCGSASDMISGASIVGAIVCSYFVFSNIEQMESGGKGITTGVVAAYLVGVLGVPAYLYFGGGGSINSSSEEARAAALANAIDRHGILSSEVQSCVQQAFFSSPNTDPERVGRMVHEQLKKLNHPEYSVSMIPGEHRLLIRNNASGNAVSVSLNR